MTDDHQKDVTSNSCKNRRCATYTRCRSESPIGFEGWNQKGGLSSQEIPDAVSPFPSMCSTSASASNQSDISLPGANPRCSARK